MIHLPQHLYVLGDRRQTDLDAPFVEILYIFCFAHYEFAVLRLKARAVDLRLSLMKTKTISEVGIVLRRELLPRERLQSAARRPDER